MKLVWNPVGSAGALAELFVKNCDRSYISHGDIDCGRASTLTEWVPNLHAVLEREIASVLDGSQTGRRVAAVASDGGYEGFAIVFVDGVMAQIEDIIVARNARSLGVGGDMMNLIFDDLRALGVRRVRAESGIRNERAHAFAARQGFVTVSKILQKDL